MQIALWQAILIGLFFWLRGLRLGYTFPTGPVGLFSPLPASLWVGIVLGNIPKAMIIGAGLQLMYLGLLAPGGALPSDATLSALIAIPVAITTHISVGTALAIAVPVGLLGAQILNLESIINGFLAHKTDSDIDKGKFNKTYIDAVLYPALYKLILYALPVILVLYFGVSHVNPLLHMIPTQITNGLNVAGEMLPAVGFAIIVQQIGRRSLLPYFFAGFFLQQYSKLPTIAIALAGLFLVYLHLNFMNNNKKSKKVQTANK